MTPKPGYQRLLLIFLLAVVIRLAGIASRPIWYDEAFSILISEQGPSAILAGTISTDTDASAAEEHPPAYYFTLWGWMKLFGNSLSSARALSIIASLGIVLLAHLIAREFFHESAALAALFAVILPFQVHYAQEIRMYVFLAFWLTLAAYALIKKQWAIFAISAALAQYTHNLAAIYLILLALTPLFQRDWKTLRALTLAGFAAMIIYSPWLTQLPAQFTKVNAAYWMERPGPEKLFTLLLVYLPNLPLPEILLLPGLLFAMLTVALAAYQTYRAARQKLPGANHGLWLACLSFGPPLLLWLISQFLPIYVERALLPSHVFFCIWLAWALTRTQLPRPVQVTAFALVLASGSMGIYQHLSYNGFPYGSYAALDNSLRGRMETGDVIIHSSKLSYLPSFYFDRDLPQSFIADPAGSGTDTLSTATMQTLSLNAAKDVESATADASRVWYIIFQRSIDELKDQGRNTYPDLEYLGKNFELESVEEWDDLRLYLFKRDAP
ncbi:MAG: glycosyltransferase family 39 protein [Chloroflexi bacterium]|nr:glycosyltransferase family 39 protein [Chloroflexota bacterium]